MTPPNVVVFAGHTELIDQVIPMLKDACTIRLFAMSHWLRQEEDIFPVPDLILVIQEKNNEDALDLLEILKQKCSETPVIFLSEEVNSEDVIRAFRLGVSDFCLFPLDRNNFLEILNGHLQDKNGLVAASSFKCLGERLQKWLGIGQHKKRRLLIPASGELAKYHPEHPAASGSLKDPLLHPELEIQFFGTFSIKASGVTLPRIPGEKVNALLAYLLYHHRKNIHREVLSSKFWGYTQSSSARNSLNVAIHSIRRHLQDHLPDKDFLIYRNDNYRISPHLDLQTDADQFLKCWRQGRSVEAGEGLEEALPYYRKAAYIYRGEFLEDLYYEEWSENERENLQETYLHILDRLAAYYFLQEDYSEAIRIFREMLSKDPCLEDAHRKLILCYYQLGQRDKAVKQYYKCVDALAEELKMEPSESTRELFILIHAETKIPLSAFLE